jgi:hypothetical protein
MKGETIIATVYTDLDDMMEEAIHRLQSCIEYSDEPLMRLPSQRTESPRCGMDTCSFE